MKIRLLLYIFPFSLQVAAQTENLTRLRNELTLSPPVKRAVCLNHLSEEFKNHVIQSDSALKYARLAYDAAAVSEDKLTKSYSLILQSEIQGQLLGNIDLMEEYGRKALAELKNIDAPIQRSHALRVLGLALIWKGKVTSADSVLLIAKTIAERSNDKAGIGSCYQLIGLNYVKNGQLWKGFKSLKEAQRIAKETGDSLVISMSLALIGRAFNYGNDPEKAIQYYQESMKYKKTALFLLYPHLEDMGYAYLKLNKPDSAVYFQQQYRHNLDSITSDVAVRKRFSVWQMPDFTMNQRIVKKNTTLY
jgi:tetratricopeptide (TPR) repeat protein